jgi:hypothetical protein
MPIVYCFELVKGWGYALSRQFELEDQNARRRSGGLSNSCPPRCSQLWWRGGPSSPNNPNSVGADSLHITTPTDTGAFQTDGLGVLLAGYSFTPDGFDCYQQTLPTGYRVTWSNNSTGVTGNATPSLDCFILVGTRWYAGVPLALGANSITVTATDGVGNIGKDTHAWSGKSEFAIERAQRALKLSPFDSLNFLSYQALAGANFHLKRYDEAHVSARRAVELNPGFSVPYAYFTAALVRLGRGEEARIAAQSVLKLNPSFSIRRFSVTVGVNPEVFPAFADAWREAGLPE